MNLLRLISFVVFALPGAVHALGLGDAYGQAVIGQPLAVRIPLQGDGAAGIVSHCVSLQAAAAGAPDARLTGATVGLVAGAATPTLLVTTRSPITQPVLSFGLRIDCGYQLTRDYHLLPSPPLPAAVPLAPPAAANSLVAPWPAPPTAGAVGGTVISMERATTLRLLSRQRYPQDSRLRVAFIRRVAAVNPELFASIEAAYDQPLAAGQTLTLPDKLPSPTDVAREPARERPTPKVAPPRVGGDSGGKGRLIIGAAGSLPAPSAMELDENINRLMDIMNEQMAVQMAMAERLKNLEKDVADAKRAAAAQAAVNQKLEADIQRLQEDQTRASYIQLVLAILLGGFAGAAVLRWRGLRLQQAADMAAAASPAPSLPPIVKAKPPQPLQSVFDDLLPPK